MPGIGSVVCEIGYEIQNNLEEKKLNRVCFKWSLLMQQQKLVCANAEPQTQICTENTNVFRSF